MVASRHGLCGGGFRRFGPGLAPDFMTLDRRGVLLALGGAAIMVVYVFAVRRLSAGADGITVPLIVAAGSTVVAGLTTTWRGDWTLPAGLPAGLP